MTANEAECIISQEIFKNIGTTEIINQQELAEQVEKSNPETTEETIEKAANKIVYSESTNLLRILNTTNWLLAIIAVILFFKFLKCK